MDGGGGQANEDKAARCDIIKTPEDKEKKKNEIRKQKCSHFLEERRFFPLSSMSCAALLRQLSPLSPPLSYMPKFPPFPASLNPEGGSWDFLYRTHSVWWGDRGVAVEWRRDSLRWEEEEGEVLHINAVRERETATTMALQQQTSNNVLCHKKSERTALSPFHSFIPRARARERERGKEGGRGKGQRLILGVNSQWALFQRRGRRERGLTMALATTGQRPQIEERVCLG